MLAYSVTGVALIAVLAGCRGAYPSGDPDRSESVVVPGGMCEIQWWLAAVSEDTPAEAKRIAADALASAEVGDAAWDEWHALLDGDPDLDSVNPVRLQGTAYLEVVRASVRETLDEAGFPDVKRVVEVYSDLDCSTN